MATHLNEILTLVQQDPDLNNSDLLREMYNLIHSQFSIAQEKMVSTALDTISPAGYAKSLDHMQPLGLFLIGMNEYVPSGLKDAQVIKMIENNNLNHHQAEQGINFGMLIASKQNSKLSAMSLMQIYSKSDLTHVAQSDQSNLVMRIIKKINTSLFSHQLFNLIQKTDLKHQDKSGFTIPMLLCSYNKSHKLNLNPKQLDEIFQKSDFSQVDNSGCNLMHHIIHKNKTENLNIPSENIKEYLKKCHLKFTNQSGQSLAFPIIQQNYAQQLGFNGDDIFNICQKSNLNQIDNNGETIASILLQCYKENAVLSNNQLTEVLLNSDLYARVNKEESFANLIFDSLSHYSLTSNQLVDILSKCNIASQKTLSSISPALFMCFDQRHQLSLEQYITVLKNSKEMPILQKKENAVVFFAMKSPIDDPDLVEIGQKLNIEKHAPHIEKILKGRRIMIDEQLAVDKFNILYETFQIKKNLKVVSQPHKIKVL